MARPAIPLALAVSALVLAAPTGASAAGGSVPFHRCFRDTPSLQCGIVSVPLDRSGAVPGSVPLHVARARARIRPGQVRGAVIGLAGGPGQSALPLFGDFGDVLGPALRTRDLVIFDQRGTGLSGVLRCRTLDRRRTRNPAKAVQACAARLGPARAFYTTRDSADDIEAIRVAEGVDKVTLYGTSYGTKVALAYAQRYPQHVERLVLDSVVDLDGPDPYYRDTFAAVPRVLKELCGPKDCAGITPDPVADIAALVKKLQGGPLRGFVVGGDGKRRMRSLGRTSIFDVLLEGDFDPRLRSDFPAAVRSALRGDAAPLLRLARIARVHDYFPPDPPRVFSNALFTATTCQEGPLPWPPATPFKNRWPIAVGGAAAIPDAAFSPFDRATGRASDTLRLCAPWPTAPPVPAPDDRPLPDVPTFIVGGAGDLRTPIENGRALAARLPHATVMEIPKTGHSALDADLSGCALRALDRFFADKPALPACPRPSRNVERLIAEVLFPPSPIPPRSTAELGAPRSLPGRAGRTIRAAELAFRDAVYQIVSSTFEDQFNNPVVRVGGLRAGRLVAREEPHVSLRLDRYSYVPGVWVSADLGNLQRKRLHLRIGGRHAARGSVTFDLRKNRIRGRIGGRRVHLRLMQEIDQAVGGLYVLRSAYRASSAGRCCSAGQVLGPPR